MGVYKFSLKMLFVNFKQSILYLISIIFTVVIIFNFLNIMTNSKFLLATGGEGNISADILFLMVLLVCVFTFYANSYFIMGKSKEMALVELDGVWPSKLARMLLFENAIVEIIGGVIGILIGIMLMPVFLLIMYAVLKTSGNILMISPQSIWGTIGILFVQLLYVGMGDYAYASTREIIDLVNGQKQVRSVDLRTLKINPIVYLIAYFIPIISIFVNAATKDFASVAIVDILFSVLAIQGLLRYYIPQKILKLKKERYSDNKIKLISLSNFYVSLKQLKFLIITLVITVEILLCIMANFKNSLQVKTICLCSYVTLIILIAVSVIYKTMLEVDSKRHLFRRLELIGYTSKQIKEIIWQEFKVVYSITIGIPLFHILIVIILLKKNDALSMKLSGILVFIFVFVFLITGIIFYNLYKKLILKNNAYRFL